MYAEIDTIMSFINLLYDIDIWNYQFGNCRVLLEVYTSKIYFHKRF